MPQSNYVVANSVPKRKRKFFERLIIIVSVIYPLSAVPQAIEVFSGRVAGVSLLSWCGFLVCASLFLVYGLKHRVPPMIISNALWVVLDSLIIIALLIARS